MGICRSLAEVSVNLFRGRESHNRDYLKFV